MDLGIKERVLFLSAHILESKDTIRATAKKFGVSKSTVHTDVSKRLQSIDKNRYLQLKKILDLNFNEKHLRGGESTRKKYLKNTKNK